MLIIPDVLSGEGDLPLDLPLELPVKFPQVNPLLLVLIVIPNPPCPLGTPSNCLQAKLSSRSLEAWPEVL